MLFPYNTVGQQAHQGPALNQSIPGIDFKSQVPGQAAQSGAARPSGMVTDLQQQQSLQDKIARLERACNLPLSQAALLLPNARAVEQAKKQAACDELSNLRAQMQGPVIAQAPGQQPVQIQFKMQQQPGQQFNGQMLADQQQPTFVQQRQQQQQQLQQQQMIPIQQGPQLIQQQPVPQQPQIPQQPQRPIVPIQQGPQLIQQPVPQQPQIPQQPQRPIVPIQQVPQIMQQQAPPQMIPPGQQPVQVPTPRQQPVELKPMQPISPMPAQQQRQPQIQPPGQQPVQIPSVQVQQKMKQPVSVAPRKYDGQTCKCTVYNPIHAGRRIPPIPRLTYNQ